ncbi:hypothetical protein ZOSMA_116G00250 [Zostera marina]|uniref:DUF538 family protein n=1 Tax=Zostera marina TaxID=29655 RepID=A0A0K9Q467_ZOSMR|nr:hypothetical protein ZOSMA_116G00250 [Zostera marina]
MGTQVMIVNKEREGAEIVYGEEDCHKHSMDLMRELGFPEGVLPLKDLVECGRVRSTGFVWMKQKKTYEHYFKGTNTTVSYSPEVTAYVEKNKMKKIKGIKSKQMMMIWVPLSEMSIDDPAIQKIFFKTPMGIGRSFPFSAFEDDDQQEQDKKEDN